MGSIKIQFLDNSEKNMLSCDKRVLLQLLDPNYVDESVTRESVTYQNFGPTGQLDKHLAILAGETHSFRTRRMIPPHTKKKKLIFSNGFFKGQAPSPFELELFSILCEEYEIYLWCDEADTHLAICKPVSTSAEFWKQKNAEAFCGATEEQVKSSLQKQALSAENYLILDFANYCKYIQKLKKYVSQDEYSEEEINYLPTIEADTIDLTERPFTEDILHFIDPYQIKTIKIKTPTQAEIKYLTDKKLFPKLEHIEIHCANEGRKSKNIPSYLAVTEVGTFQNKVMYLLDKREHKKFSRQGNNIKEILVMGMEKGDERDVTESLTFIENCAGINVFDCTKLKELKVSSNELKSITLPKVPCLEMLDLKELPGECQLPDLSLYNNLKFLSIDYQHHCLLSKLELPLPTMANLEELKLSILLLSGDLEATVLDFKHCEKIKKIELEYINLENLDLSQKASLEECNLSYQHVLKELKINDCESLKRLKINKAKKLEYISLSKLHNLEELFLSCCGIKSLDFAHCINLKSLKISRCPLDEKFNLSHLINLEKLSLSDCGLESIDLSHCKKLKSLYIRKLSIEKWDISVLENLEELTIKECDLADLTSLNLSKCKKLKRLKIIECENIKHLNLSMLANLEELLLEQCASVSSYDFKGCLKLKNIIIDGACGACPQDFSALPNLEKLSGESCPNIDLAKLKVLKIIFNAELKNLESLKLSNLEELTISNCTLTHLDFKNLQNVKRLTIKCCSKLETIDFSKLPKLEMIEIFACPNIKELDLSPCKNLKVFDAFGLKVESLDISHCTELESLTSTNILAAHANYNLSHLSHLKKANLSNKRGTSFTINLQNAISLNKLTVEGSLVNLNLAKNKELQHLQVSAKTDAYIANFDHCDKLKYAKFKVQNPTRLIANISATDCSVEIESVDPTIKETDGHSLQEIKEGLEESKRVDYQIIQQNKSNPVACFSDSLFDDRVVDDDTAESDKPYKAAGNFKLLLDAQKPISRADQRIRIVDSIKLIGDKIHFYTHHNEREYIKIEKKFTGFDALDYEAISRQVKMNPKLAMGCFIGEQLDSDKIYPLPTHQAMTKNQTFDLYCLPQDAIELFWHSGHQQYYFRPNTSAGVNAKIELLYVYNKNINYDGVPDSPLLIQDNTALLPEPIITAYRSELKSIDPKHKLHFLTDEKIPVLEKIQLLINYCESFENTALATKPQTGIENLLKCAWEQKGACRHRSEVFMTLARYLGIPARIILCENHEYCEIPYVAGDGIQWQRVQLNGSPTNDVTEQQVRSIEYQRIAPARTRTSIQFPVSDVKEEKERTPAQEKFYRHIKSIIQKREISDIRELLNKRSALAPLIELSADQDPFSVSKQILQQLSENKHFNPTHHYIFINRPEDFDQYLRPYQLKDGRRSRIRGPLDKMIDNTDGTGGILVVNWSNFTAAQIASYKSIIDALPTLSGKKIHSNVTVIGLITQATQVCSAFSSRCQRCVLKPAFISAKTSASQDEKKDEIEKVDLFGRLDWRDYIFGKIHFNGDKIEISEGPLLRAIQKNCPLHITNPPQDKEFDNLLKRIQAEGKFFFNGEFIKVPAGVTIKTNTLSHKMECDQVRVHEDGKENKLDLSNMVYLGLHNLHECFEKLIISKDKKAHELEYGFLKDHTIFYLTESITKADWQLIIDTIVKMCEKISDKKPLFHFILAPGVSIEGGHVNEIKQSILESFTSKSTTILSNDPDYFCRQHFESKSSDKIHIINVTPQTGFDKLFAKLTWNSQLGDPSKVEFNLEEQSLLKAIRAGHQIILKGDISSDLYKQLIPMLSAHPYLYINGERIALKRGQVIAVMNNSAKEKMIFPHYSEYQYGLKDYLLAFPDDQQHIKNIYEFFSWAQKLPLTGLGRPDKLAYSHERLTRMLHDLKHSPLHKQNPIKGNILYDYPKGSEDYCYLNVIGKLLFHRKDEKPAFRPEKMERLLADPNRNLWRILNCFNGSALVNIFGENWRDNIVLHEGMPTLSSKAMEIFRRQIMKKFITSTREHKLPSYSSHYKKREWQLKTLLEDKNTPLIILKGPPGVGKTYTINQLKKKHAYYEGENNIQKWLADSSNKIKILFLDEANMKNPGTWDFLKNINPSPKHKILLAVNPETYPGRYYHSFFQHYGETISFKMPDRHFLDKQYLETILKPKKLEKYSKALLDAYDLIQKYNPHFAYSHRDLENVAKRLIVLAKEKSGVLEACIEEFALTIQDPKVRQAFILELADTLQVDNLIERGPAILTLEIPNRNSKTNNKPIYIPTSKFPIVRAIENHLKVRQQALESKSPGFYKQGIMLEGNAGLGKSTLYEALLIKYNKEHPKNPIKYYTVSAGDDHAHEILKQAHREGAVVVLDELNLDPALEALLCELLTTASPGFMVLASQNPHRSDNSEAIRNRLQWIYMDPETRETNTSIASCQFFSAAPDFVAAFEECQAEQPKDVNSRTFYTALHEPV